MHNRGQDLKTLDGRHLCAFLEDGVGPELAELTRILRQNAQLTKCALCLLTITSIRPILIAIGCHTYNLLRGPYSRVRSLNT